MQVMKEVWRTSPLTCAVCWRCVVSFMPWLRVLNHMEVSPSAEHWGVYMCPVSLSFWMEGYNSYFYGEPN